MKTNTSLEDLEALMAQACIALSDAAYGVDALPIESRASFKRKVADALVKAWDARDILHALRPELKPVYLLQTEKDPQAYEQYSEVMAEFHQLQHGDMDKGFAVLREFVPTCSSAYFAGLAARTMDRYRNSF